MTMPLLLERPKQVWEIDLYEGGLPTRRVDDDFDDTIEPDVIEEPDAGGVPPTEYVEAQWAEVPGSGRKGVIQGGLIGGIIASVATVAVIVGFGLMGSGQTPPAPAEAEAKPGDVAIMREVLARQIATEVSGKIADPVVTASADGRNIRIVIEEGADLGRWVNAVNKARDLARGAVQGKAGLSVMFVGACAGKGCVDSGREVSMAATLRIDVKDQ